MSSTDEKNVGECIEDLLVAAAAFEQTLTSGIDTQMKWWRQLLGASLIRGASLCRSIASLSKTGNYWDADILVRAFVEQAITVAWMGDDEAKAESLRDSGLDQMRKWKEAMEQHGPLPPSALARFNKCMTAHTGKTAPKVEGRTHGNPLLKEAYDFAYRRSSSSAHTELRVLSAAIGDKDRDHAPVILHDAVMAALIVMKVAAAAFDDAKLQTTSDQLESRVKAR